MDWPVFSNIFLGMSLERTGAPQVDDISLRASAQELIDLYGDGAAAEARRMVAQMISTGDVQGELVWGRIAAMLEDGFSD